MIFLVDKSVLARRHLPAVAAALRSRLAKLAICDVTALELGWSARNLEHYRYINRDLDEYLSLPVTEACWAIAKAWQGLLVRDGHHRGPEVADLVIGATAVHPNAFVLHYDADFEAIASVESRFHHQWAVPRGSAM